MEPAARVALSYKELDNERRHHHNRLIDERMCLGVPSGLAVTEVVSFGQCLGHMEVLIQALRNG